MGNNFKDFTHEDFDRGIGFSITIVKGVQLLVEAFCNKKTQGIVRFRVAGVDTDHDSYTEKEKNKFCSFFESMYYDDLIPFLSGKERKYLDEFCDAVDTFFN